MRICPKNLKTTDRTEQNEVDAQIRMLGVGHNLRTNKQAKKCPHWRLVKRIDRVLDQYLNGGKSFVADWAQSTN